MKFLLVLFIAVAFATTGEALRCYLCSWPQSGCEDPFDKSAVEVIKTTCSAMSHSCTKTVGVLTNGTSIYLRTCGSGQITTRKSFNRATYNFASVSEHYCDADLCNGVSTTSAALSMLMVLALPFIFGNNH